MYISRNLVALLALWSPTQLCLAIEKVSFSSSEGVQYIENRFIIKYENTAAGKKAKQSILDSPDKGITLVNEISNLHIQSVSFPSATAASDFLEKQGEGVKYFEEDSMVYLDPIPTTDPQSQNLAETTPYGINHVKALDVPDDNSGNRKVCIVDSGYDITHPDLPSDGSIVTGESFGGVGSWNTDGSGHGTHVAGTVAAIGGNGIGVKGVIRNGQVKLHISRVFPDSGGTSTFNVIAGFNSCVDNGANVVNMSLGGGGYIQSFAEAIENAYDDGILILASSGNSGDGTINYPASYPHVMSVASITESYTHSSFSTYNNLVDISAPGSSVYSTVPGGSYSYLSGTSMASPHAAGVAALVWSHSPSLENSELENILQTTARDLGTSGRDDFYGHGLVDAKAAYDALDLSAPTVSPVAAPVACSSSEVLVEVYIKTDSRPRQIRWKVYNVDTQSIIVEENSYSSSDRNLEFTYEVCVDSATCLQFEITDSVGDGICCEHGDGAYSVTYDGAVVDEGEDNFDSVHTSPTFGCDSSPTGFPIASPTASPVTCVDSPIDMAYTDGPSDVYLPCSWVETFASACLCDDENVRSHCPLTCDSCDEYRCEDSTALFYAEGLTLDCEELYGFTPGQIGRICRDVIARETCRSLCGVCD